MAKLTEKEKVDLLEAAVLRNDLEAVRQLYAEHGTFEFTARAVGYAACFIGTDMLKLLLENGAGHDRDNIQEEKYHRSIFSDGYISLLFEADPCRYISRDFPDLKPAPELTPLSAELKCDHLVLMAEKGIGYQNLDYHFLSAMCDPTFSVAECMISRGLVSQKRMQGHLVYSLYNCYLNRYRFLRSKNCGMSESDAKALADKTVASPRSGFLDLLAGRSGVYMGDKPTDAHKLYIFQELVSLMQPHGVKLCVTDAMIAHAPTEVIRDVFLPKCDMSGITGSKLCARALECNDPALMTAVLEGGWLKTRKARDTLIEKAAQQQKTELLAILMDYKNRTADPKKEAAATSRKVKQELETDPTSAKAMKKLWSFKALPDNTYRLTSYKGTSTDIVIPEMIEGCPVTSVDEKCFAFKGSKISPEQKEIRKNITSIVFPGTIRKLPWNLFHSPEVLEEYDKLTSVTFGDGIQAIGGNMFRGCSALTEVTIPESVTVIHGQAFAFSGLQKITFGSGVKEMGEGVFMCCNQLKQIDLPAGIHTIRKETFYWTGLEEVFVPDGVTQIGYRAFFDCKALHSIHIPATVTQIGRDAFGRCPKLTIYAPAGSHAEAYAKAYEIPFVAE